MSAPAAERPADMKRLSLLEKYNPRLLAVTPIRRLVRELCAGGLEEREAVLSARSGSVHIALDNVNPEKLSALRESAPGVTAGQGGSVLISATRDRIDEMIRRLDETEASDIAPAITDSIDAFDRRPQPIVVSSGKLEFGGRTLVMGVLNVTPDSFSDGGEFFDTSSAIDHALQMAEEGADIIDVGGESTRPGSDAVPTAEQLRRVLPIIEKTAAQLTIPVSIDTTDAEVAEKALDAGAEILNDISALRSDSRMAGLAAERDVPVVLMHMQGTPRTMQENPTYRNVVSEVAAFLRERISFAARHGVREENTIIDPGIGFGKSIEHNLELLARLRELRSIGRPVLIGTSRKSMIGLLLDRPVKERTMGTAATIALSVAGGADIVRVHDVKETVQVCRVAEAIEEL